MVEASAFLQKST